jgi:hypothetical protein
VHAVYGYRHHAQCSEHTLGAHANYRVLGW